VSAPARPVADLKVALFATCFNDTMWPETPKATVRLLERLGCRVEFPMEQTCCGQMLTNTGYGSKAVPLVRRFVDVFEGYDAVVAPSGSCVGSVREQHPGIVELVGDDRLASRVEHLTPKVYELSEFLVDVLGVTDVGAYFPHRVTYHPTCHSMRIAKVGDRPLRLLQAVRGIDLVDLPNADQCCGFGGTFAVKMPEISQALVADKAACILATGADTVVVNDGGCTLNIAGYCHRHQIPVRFVHIAQLLAESLGLMEDIREENP